MPVHEQTDHEVIIDTFYRYARIDDVDGLNDLADITILDADGQPTSETYQRVPIFYHCYPDSALRANGAIEGAARAFTVGDTAIVKFEGGSPVVMAHKEKLVTCRNPGAVFIRPSTGEIFLAEHEGTPWDGNFTFKQFFKWGEAKSITFTGDGKAQRAFRWPWETVDRYWVLDNDGKVYHRSGEEVFFQSRRKNKEALCTGLPSGITDIHVYWYDYWAHMVLSRIDGADEVVDHYKSLNGDTWEFVENLFSGANGSGKTWPVHNFKGMGGADLGIWQQWSETGIRDRYHMEHFYSQPQGHPEGYPPEYFRIWRIGVLHPVDAYGNLTLDPVCWTAVADAAPSVQLTFWFENYFSVEGMDINDLQIIQVWGAYWS
jgi:hypothetical protein